MLPKDVPKPDVRDIRHVYLDFDEGGDQAIQRLLSRSDVPSPNYLLSSSPGKWQAVWSVEGFEKEQAEALQRRLARDTGADIAATDCSRVLRLPGFRNHKYTEPHFVEAQRLSSTVARPEHFPSLPNRVVARPERASAKPDAKVAGSQPRESQSERDWAYARRALLRGDSHEKIIDAIAHYRSDKADPQYYANLTVHNAAASLSETRRPHALENAPER